MDAKPTSSNGLKSAGSVVAIVAVITGIAGLCFAMIEPMGQRIDFTERTVDKHLELLAHHGAVHDLARINEVFAEIETQFEGLREVLETRVEHLEEEVLRLRKWQAGHNQTDGARSIQIQMLERAAYGADSP